MAERVLWDDVPSAQRVVHPHFRASGCPYAVRLNVWELKRYGAGAWEAYHRCGGPVTDSGACGSHRTPAAVNPDTVRKRARRAIERTQIRTIGDLRRLSDHDIDAMWQVGVKLSALIREMRDSWPDERVLEAMPFLKRSGSHPPVVPLSFWTQTRDALAMVGG